MCVYTLHMFLLYATCEWKKKKKEKKVKRIDARIFII